MKSGAFMGNCVCVIHDAGNASGEVRDVWCVVQSSSVELTTGRW